jgi:hypothetical protein
MISAILKTKNLHESTSSHHIVRNQKIFGRLFCFQIGICSYSFCIAFDGASFEKKIKILSFSQAEIHAKQKSFPNIFLLRKVGDRQNSSKFFFADYFT